MPSLNLSRRTIRLSFDNIEKYVRKNKAGNIALGVLQGNSFIPKFVCRCDKDIQAVLKKYVSLRYTYFKYRYAGSVKKAYLRECRNFHDFEHQLDNTEHPRKPEGMKVNCPWGCDEG